MLNAVKHDALVWLSSKQLHQYEPSGNVLAALGIVDMRRDPGSIRF